MVDRYGNEILIRVTMAWTRILLCLYLTFSVTSTTEQYCYRNSDQHLSCSCDGKPPDFDLTEPYPGATPGGCNIICIVILCLIIIGAAGGVVLGLGYCKKKKKMCWKEEEEKEGRGHVTLYPKPLETDQSVEMGTRTTDTETGSSPKHEMTKDNTMEDNTKHMTKRQKSTDPLLQNNRRLSDPDAKYEYKSSPEKDSPTREAGNHESPRKKKKKKKKKHKKHAVQEEGEGEIEPGTGEVTVTGNPKHHQTTTSKSSGELPPVNHPNHVVTGDQFRPLPALGTNTQTSFTHA
ncbi:uncharacterized protein LOC144452479 isoform X2 [Glandiceps talaboti]